ISQQPQGGLLRPQPWVSMCQRFMKTNYLSFCVMFLVTATSLSATDLATNVVHHSCCQPVEASLKALPDKSVYQLETAWTNDEGKTFKLNSLRGRPQVVAMFFASCQYTCPLTVFQMKQLETALPTATHTNVGFTLVSFDSKHDKPAVLKDYRTQHELSPGNWT